MNFAPRKRQCRWAPWVVALGASSTMMGPNLNVVWDGGIDRNVHQSKSSPLEESSLLVIGAIIGAAIADIFGRRRTLLATSIFLIPRILLPYLTEELHRRISTLFVSFGSGITLVLVPLYISEIADTNYRSNLLVLQYSVRYLGLLFACVVNAFFMIHEGAENGVMDRFAGTVLLACSIAFHVSISWLNPETREYSNWKKINHQAIVDEQGPTNVCANPNFVTEEEQGLRRGMKIFVQPKDRRVLFSILTLISVRQASGQEWILSALMDITKVDPNREIPFLAGLVFFALSLIVSIFILLTLDLFKRKEALLVIMAVSFFAALMGCTSITEHYWCLVTILYMQRIAHYIFIGFTLAYVAEFVSVNTRAVSIAVVITWEVMMRVLFLLVSELWIDNGIGSIEGTWKHSVFNSVALYISFLVVMCSFRNFPIAHHIGNRNRNSNETEIMPRFSEGITLPVQ